MFTEEQKEQVRSKIEQFQRETGVTFRTAFEWDEETGFYSDMVMPSDLGLNYETSISD